MLPSSDQDPVQAPVLLVIGDSVCRGMERESTRKWFQQLRARGWKLRFLNPADEVSRVAVDRASTSVTSKMRWSTAMQLVSSSRIATVEARDAGKKTDIRSRLSQRWREGKRSLTGAQCAEVSALLSLPGSIRSHVYASYLRRVSGRPWLAYLGERERAPWIPSDSTIKNGASAAARLLLSQTLTDADVAVVDCDAARQFWIGQLPLLARRIERVYPSWFEFASQSERMVTEHRVRAHRGPIRLLVRNSSHRAASLRPLLSVLAVLRDRCPELAGAIEVTLQGRMLPEEIHLAAQAGVIRSPLDNQQALDAELITVLGYGQDDDIVPPELWSAMAMRRPVFSLGGSDEAERILQRTGLGVHIHWRARNWVDQGAAMLQRAIFRRANGRSLVQEYGPRRSALVEFSAESAGDRVDQLLGEICPSISWLRDDLRAVPDESAAPFSSGAYNSQP